MPVFFFSFCQSVHHNMLSAQCYLIKTIHYFFQLHTRYTIHELLWAINCIIIIWPWSSPMILIDLIIFIFFCVYLVLNTFKIKELHLFERNSDLNFFCLDLFDLTSGIPYFWLSVVSKKMFKISSSNKDVYEREQLIKICQYFF